MKNKSAYVPLLLFLVAATVLIGLLNPAFAIFPAFVLFLVCVGLFFQPKHPEKAEEIRLDTPRGPTRLSLAEETRSLRRDEDIVSDVIARITADPALRDDGIDVRSRFGQVILAGRVKTESERERARALAASVSGVIEVVVQLRVVPGGRTA